MRNSSKQPLFEFIFRVFIYPTSKLINHEDRQRTIALSTITLSYILLLIPLSLYLYFGIHEIMLSKVLLASICLHFLCYLLSRTGRYKAGGLLLSLSVAFGVFAAILASLGRPEVTLITIAATVYLSISLQLAGLLGNYKQVIAVLIAIVVGVAVVYPKLPNFNVAILISLYTSFSFIAVINLIIHKLRDSDFRYMEVQRAKTAFRSRMASLAEMSSGISHEINNPLTIIEGYANQIITGAKQGKVNVAQNLYLGQKIIEKSERIAKVIRSLRAISRESSKEPLAAVPLSKIISDSLIFCQMRFKHHNVAIHYEEISAALKINCRPVQIAQVFLHVLYNAYDAVKSEKERWVKVTVEDHPNFVLIGFANSGPTISPELSEKIFLPFFTTKDIGSSGLGLSICISIINEHNGEIELEKNSPHTRFIIKIPKAAAAPETGNLAA